MAKMTIEGVTYEGTPEELAGIVREFTKIQAVSKPAQFSEGDRVKTLASCEDDDIKAGEYGVVVDTDCGSGHDDPYTIRVETDDDYGFFRPQDLELVVEAKPVETLKVGDYVVANTPNPDAITDEDMELGEVTEKYGSGEIRVKVIAHKTKARKIGEDYAVSAKYFRKATEAEVEAATSPVKPKTGDIVVITANTNSSRNKVGDIGKVEEISGMNPVVLVPGRKGGRGCTHTKYSEMRLATPAEIAQYKTSLKPKEPTLKVGDTVRVEGSSWFKDGTITKVKRLGGWSGDIPEQVLLEGGNSGLSIETKYVTKLDEPCAFVKAGRKPNEYRKGDLGRITDTKGAPGYSKGDIVEVDRDFNGTSVVDAVHLNDEYIVRIEIVCFAENRVDAKGVA